MILAGADFSPFAADVQRLGLSDRVIVREQVSEIEDYLQAADIGLFTSDMESFCLSILEAMCFGCPSVATAAGGVPEVVESGVSGILLPAGDAEGLARAVESLIADPSPRAAWAGGPLRATTVLGRRHRPRLRGDLSASLPHLTRSGDQRPTSPGAHSGAPLPPGARERDSREPTDLSHHGGRSGPWAGRRSPIDRDDPSIRPGR